MTYEKFKEIIERTGEYRVVDTFGTVIAVHTEKYTLCHVSKTRPFGIDTIFGTDTTYSENEDFFKEYLDTIIEFAKTPIEDRYPVKKYYVKPDLPEFIYKQSLYLNKIICDEYINYTLNNRFQVGNHQTQFTMEEIKEIIPEEDMDKFKFIPVEEEK